MIKLAMIEATPVSNIMSLSSKKIICEKITKKLLNAIRPKIKSKIAKSIL